MKLDSTNVGKTISFETVAGEKINNLKLVSIPDAATVLALGGDPVAKHRQYLPYIPDPKPLQYTDYLYAKFLDADGKSWYYGIPWIKPTSIVENSNVTYLFRCRNASTEQIDSIKQMMVKSGIEDFTVEVL